LWQELTVSDEEIAVDEIGVDTDVCPNCAQHRERVNELLQLQVCCSWSDDSLLDEFGRNAGGPRDVSTRAQWDAQNSAGI